ncbi:hypothetical protein L9F63_000138, partial [Diploptera punctata]
VAINNMDGTQEKTRSLLLKGTVCTILNFCYNHTLYIVLIIVVVSLCSVAGWHLKRPPLHLYLSPSKVSSHILGSIHFSKMHIFININFLCSLMDVKKFKFMKFCKENL